MGETTAIEWTNTYLDEPVIWKRQTTAVIPGATFNPWWGCVKVSRACKNCYAENFANRFTDNLWGPDSDRRMFDDAHWAEPLKWNAECERLGILRKVFCGSMCDWAEDREDLIEPRKRLFNLIENTPHLIWLMLTKRSERIYDLIPGKWKMNPPRNVWQGVTVESKKEIHRIQDLIKVPAAVRFISCEPLMSELNIAPYLGSVVQFGDPLPLALFSDRNAYYDDSGLSRGKVHWVIAGGESGQKSEPSNPEWFTSLLQQCEQSGTPFFFKQWGGVNKKISGRLLNGIAYNDMPDHL